MLQEMVKLMEGEVKNNPNVIVNTRDYVRRCMWDISGIVTMGFDWQTLSNPDGGIRDQFSSILAEFSGPAWVRMLMHYVDVRPLVSLFEPLFKNTPLVKSLDYIRGEIRRIIGEKEVVYKKSGSSKAQGPDIASISVASGVFPTDELVDNGMLFMTAGPNSSGAAIEWSIYELSRRPDIQERLRDEVHKCIKWSPPSDVGPSLQSLPYLTAFINEIIRYYPFIPLSARAAEKDTTLLGEHIPKNMVLHIPTNVLNQDPELWGPDAAEFNPDRWMGDGATLGGASSNYAMLSFGAGPNVCIGQHTARGMIGCFLAALVHRFDVKLANADTAADLQPALFKRSKEGMMAKLTILETE